VCENRILRVKSHCAGGNSILRVEITLVLVEMTLVRVVIADFLSSLPPPPHGSAPALLFFQTNSLL
jgi:hypothetical protein